MPRIDASSPERQRAARAALAVQGRGGLNSLPPGDPLRREFVTAVRLAAGLRQMPKSRAEKRRYTDAALRAWADVERALRCQVSVPER